MSVQFIIEPEAASSVLARKVNGKGGYQSLLRRIQAAMKPALFPGGKLKVLITLSDDDFMRLSTYMTSYGQGGFQDRLLEAFGVENGFKPKRRRT